MTGARRLSSEAAFVLERAARLAKGFVVSQEHGEPSVYREVRLHRGLDGATIVLVWDRGVRPRASALLTRALVALAALLVVVLSPHDAYAREAKASAPIGRQSDEAHDQRGTSSMGHDDDSAPAAPAEGDELESSLRDIRAAALSGDLESLRAAVVALESRIRARNGEDTGPNATADEEAEWLGYLEKETDPARRIVLERFNNFRHPWGARTELSSYAPHPDEPGMMAARICEGEARLPWFPPDENVTEADFVAGQKLVSEVVRAFSGGDRTVLDRLELAWAHLTDDALTLRQATRLHADYLRWVTHKITSAREEEAKVDEARRTNAERAHFVEGAMWQSHWLSVNALARYFDQKFAALTREELREKLLSASTETGRGRGRIGAPRIGAELAVRVGAFGATDVAEFAATLGRAATKGARPKK